MDPRPTSQRKISSAEKRRRRDERISRWKRMREEDDVRIRRHHDDEDEKEEHFSPHIYEEAAYAVHSMAADLKLRVDVDHRIASIDDFQRAAMNHIRRFLRVQLERNRQLKFRIVLQVELNKHNEEGEIIQTDRNVFLSSFPQQVAQQESISAEVDICFSQIAESLDGYNQNGSNWILERVKGCVVSADKYRAVQGGVPGGSYFETPEWLRHKKAIINIENDDDLCFKYCMEAGYDLPKKDPQRVSKYKNRNTFTYKEQPTSENDDTVMSFPFAGQKKALKEFERLNQHLNISVNAYFADSKSRCSEHIAVLYQTSVPILPTTKQIDLLLLEHENGNRHWVLIKNFRRLFHLSHNNLTICRRCLIRMPTYKLTSHLEHCNQHVECKTKLPEAEHAFAGFKNYRKRVEVPFVIYADFECISECQKQDKFLDKDHILRTHVPNAFAYVRICNFDSEHTSELKLYRAEKSSIRYNAHGVVESDVGEKFIQYLEQEKAQIYEILRNRLIEGRYLVMNDQAEQQFQNATHCHICQLPFQGGYLPQWKDPKIDSVKVRDHDHLKKVGDGETNYRGAAHAWCNLQFHVGFKIAEKEEENQTDEAAEETFKISTFQYKIPVVFHNLKGYDGHIIIRAIKSYNADDIFCIPQDGEKFLSFSFSRLKFIDSLQFLNSSLEKLVDVMKKDQGVDNFKYLKHEFSRICERFRVQPTADRLKLLLSKGVYPYDYMDSFDRFDEVALPPKEKFKSILDDSELSDEEYAHAQKIWVEFNIRNLGDYHDLYLITDVMLLTDVFQRFRQDALKDTGIEPLHYVSLPGYSLDVCYFKSAQDYDCLKQAIVPFRVEVFNNGYYHQDMYLFCENAVRGGISMIPGRFAQANHKYMLNYDPSKPSSFIMYVDANNLYGWAMSQPMPIGNYRWHRDPSQFTEERILQLPDTDDIGYLFEVDLDIPVELHDKFRHYPLAPESLSVNEEEVSEHTKKLREKTQSKHDGTVKLLCTLKNKRHYTTHYRNLKLYLKLGYKLVQVHRVLQFAQRPWIKDYIATNTAKRAQCTNEFSKDLFKLLNNAVFGKFLQDDRKHRKAAVCNNPWKYQKHVSSPFYDSRKIVNEDTVITYLRKDEIMLDKPIIVGVSILELSKLHMYDFYYNTLYRIFGDRLRLLMTDTDSLCFQVESDDFHEEIRQHNVQHKFDWSNYPKDHPMYDTKGKAVLGLFKDETAGYWIKEFAGLRSKMYSILKDDKSMMGVVEEGGEKKVAKGVKKHIIKNKLRHDEYRQCLLNQEYDPNDNKVSMVGFKTFNNLIHTTEVMKTTLSGSDDKLYLCDDGISTLPYGYHSLCS
jgi:hypothetical protein